MSGKIRDIDRGFRALKKRIEESAKGVGLTVGVHANEGAAQHRAEKGEDAPPEPVTVLDVAIWNEFGIGVPERSFLRAWVDENSAANKEKLRKAMMLVVRGQMPIRQALELVGLAFVGSMQKRIAQGIDPPNAPRTIAEKGSSTPLIDKGQLRQSLTYKTEIGSKPPA